MKFINPRRFADPDAGARRLMKLANAFEPVRRSDMRLRSMDFISAKRNRSSMASPSDV
jgi:hypothetical protein